MTHPSNPLPPELIEQGTCYGFAIRAAVRLACLREGRGTPLEVSSTEHQPPAGMRLVTEEHDGPTGQPYARLYRDGQTYWLWVTRAGWTKIDTDGSHITLPLLLHPEVIEEHLWGMPLSLCLLHRGDLILHGAAVDVHGEAVVLTGPGGSGKSTLAAALVQTGHRLLSEDITCVRLDGGAYVVPGPAMLRLRPDVLSHVTLARSRVIRRIASRVTFALDPDARGGCEPVRVRAVYLLDTPSKEPSGARIVPAEVIPRLWPLTFRLPEERWTARCFRQLGDLISTVPVQSFPRPASLEELPRAVEDLTS